MTSKSNIYHEKQVKEMCALHALNNLFQVRGAYSKSDLDTICSRLSPNVWINPHRSMLGLGNYDINVIMAALQKKGCEAVWFDKRKDPGCLDLSNVCGFILNVPSDYKLGFVMLPLRRRHWITIRQIQGLYYNLDSKLDAPQLIGRGSDLIAYLKEQLECKEKELFIVVSKDVEEKQTWMHQYTNNVQRDVDDQYNRQDQVHDQYNRQDQFHDQYNRQDQVHDQYNRQDQLHDQYNHVIMTDSPDTASNSYDYYSRDSECVTINDVRNCVGFDTRDSF